MIHSTLGDQDRSFCCQVFKWYEAVEAIEATEVIEAFEVIDDADVPDCREIIQ